MQSAKIRDKFLRFFEEKGCLIAPSDSLVPDDPTLLFTSAGMVQFKPYFTGDRIPPRTRMTTSQKCLRTGDLEIVGTTPFHHTFFEMLGNFSFGDYFKDEAIVWAWEFLTQILGLPKEKLWVTIYKDDDEAAEIWGKKVGVPTERLIRLGEKSNYWPANAPSEGPNGPCGPCSEIFMDFGSEVGCLRPDCGPDCDCGRFSEIWNLVFMQYNREDGGVLTPLPKKNIDTGMGLERISAVLQNTKTNFETDLFLPLIEQTASIAGVEYGKRDETDVALRVIADHVRAIVFTIADGVMPSNIGRGYVLRRIIRRAALKGRVLGLRETFLAGLAPIVVDAMKDAYPDLIERLEHISRTICAEEEKFLRTLDIGLQKLEEAFNRLSSQGTSEIPGMEAFVLYDTYGFPLELVQEEAAKKGFGIDVKGFDNAMDEQRRKAREGSDISADVFAGSLGALAEIEKISPATSFLGYDTFTCEAEVIGILKNGELVNSASEGDSISIVLDRTPFYAESGGQVADTGKIAGSGVEVRVDNTFHVGSLIVHAGKVNSGVLQVGDKVTAEVDSNRRKDIMRNHTATHLLHKALRMMLGDHVVQSGSLVEPNRLRFDFTHFQAVTAGELREIEKIVNDIIIEDREVKISETTLEQAKEDGAMALFGEKYSGTVRVVDTVGFSTELCGGTHVHRTSQIGLFKILSESSVGAGLRRIEAVTGRGALEYVLEQDRLLNETASVLKSTCSDAPEAAARLLESLRSSEKKISDLQREGSSNEVDELLKGTIECNGVKLIAEIVKQGDPDSMSVLADKLAAKLGSGIVMLGGSSDGKAVFVCKVTPDLVKRGMHAGNLVREVAKVASGGGGGRPDFAKAGGKDASKLKEALARARELVEQASS